MVFCGVDYRFVFRVAFFMLPKPRLRDDFLSVDRAESLSELGVIVDGYFAC